jgi:mono/diheme cytochrome c family protein
MKKMFAALLVFITTGFALASDCHLRARTSYSTYLPTHKSPTLYYYSGGYYYEYKGGDRGPLYYWSDGRYWPYDHHDYKYKETVILVPKAIQVEVNRDHYYSINSAAAQDLLADAIVGRLLRMQGELKSTPRTTPTTGGGTPSGTKPKEKDLGDDRAGAHQDANLLKTVNDSCAKCHGAGSKYTKFVTTDGKLTDLPAGKVWEAFGLVNSGEMPKGGKSIADEEVKLFYAWAKAARKD